MFEKDEEFLAHVPVEHDVVVAFEEGRGPGPNPHKPQFDMDKGPDLTWNSEVIGLLLGTFKNLKDGVGWALPERSDDLYRHYLKSKYNTLRSNWTSLRPRPLPGHIMESADQARDRVVDRSNNHVINSRRRGCQMRVSRPRWGYRYSELKSSYSASNDASEQSWS
jgi:hypothetical protein